MNYDVVTLAVAPEEAHDRITAAVSGLRTSESNGGYEYRTSRGFHLATVSEQRTDDGDRYARLRYRTAIVSPTAAHARRKARAIKDAVADEIVPSPRT